jgi:hypothetical protein
MAVSFADLHEGTRVKVLTDAGVEIDFTIRNRNDHILDVTLENGLEGVMLFAYSGLDIKKDLAELRTTFMRNAGAHIEPNMVGMLMAESNAFFRVRDAQIV